MTRAAWLMVLLLGVSTEAEAFTGSELYRACENSDHQDFNEITCVAYVRGYVGGMAMGVGMIEAGKKYCPPKTFDVLQAKLIIQKFMRDYPESLSMEASMLSGIAIIQAFPCHQN